MNAFISTDGDQPCDIEVHGLPGSLFHNPDLGTEKSQRDYARAMIISAFSSILDENCDVWFDDECPECKSRYGHSSSCPAMLDGDDDLEPESVFDVLRMEEDE